MSTKKEPPLLDVNLLQSFTARRVVSAANERTMHRIDAGIFAELLPATTKQLASLRSSRRHSWSHPDSGEESRSRGASTLDDSPVSPPLHAPATWVRKESPPMKAYRTESPYYFSSKQLLPVGSLVFFSEKLKRYVHPTGGILRDGYPRLQVLSETESHALEDHWREALAGY